MKKINIAHSFRLLSSCVHPFHLHSHSSHPHSSYPQSSHILSSYSLSSHTLSSDPYPSSISLPRLTLTLILTLTLTFACLLLLSTSLSAQTPDKTLETNRAYTGAKANKKSYHAIYQLDSNDPRIIEKAIRNLNNALTDPRLNGKIQIELVTFAGGTEAALKGSKYEAELKDLVEKGVIVAQCNNSLRERKIDRDQVYDFIAVVPSGNGELIIRQAEGWAIIKP